MFSFSKYHDMLDMDNIESDEYSRRLKVLNGLKSALRTQTTKSFVERFIELDGLSSLLQFLLSMNSGKFYLPNPRPEYNSLMISGSQIEIF